MNAMQLLSAGRSGQLGASPFSSVPVSNAASNYPNLTYGSGSLPTFNSGYSTPSYNPNAPVTVLAPATPVNHSNTGSNTMAYFNTIAGIVSQAIQGWSHNPTNQVATGVGVVTNPNVAIAGSQAQQYQPYQQAYPQGAAPGGLGAGLGSGLDGIINWGLANPIYPIGAGIVLWLLFKTPPGKK